MANKVKNNKFTILGGALLGSLILTTGFATGVFSYSWFTNKDALTEEYKGQTVGAYFAGGDGSSENPYIIKSPIHMYNLAWLQHIGYFNKDADGDGTIDKQFYFEVADDINMSGWTLPPIGDSTYPFLGNFDGGNHTISYLKVSNKIAANEITKHPAAVTADSFSGRNVNIVGAFGIIGSLDNDYGYTYDSEINSVSNFYLDNVTIDACGSNILCGLLAGYVNGSLTDSGVHYGNINLESGTSKLDSFSNVSSYTLIGDYNKDKFSWETDSGSGSGDTGYGTSTNIVSFYDKLSTNPSFMEGSTVTIPKSYALPIKFDNNSSIISGSESKSVTSSGVEINVNYASTLPVSKSATNIGYYSGGEIKSYKHQYSSSTLDFDKMVAAGNSPIDPFSTYKPPTQEVVDHVNKIKEYLKADDGQGYRNGDSAMVFSGTYFDDGSSETKPSTFPTSKDNYLLVKNAKVGKWEGDLFIPARGIWVAPIAPGTFEFVAVNEKTLPTQLAIFRLKRSTPKDYSTGFTNTTYIQRSDFTNDMCGAVIYGGSKPNYYGISVTQADIDAGYEYFITKYKSSNDNPFVVYIDIGTDGGDSGDEEKTFNWTFDFVGKDSDSKIIKINDSAYTKTNLAFSIAGTSSSDYAYYFRSQNGTVYYYFSSAYSGLTLTPDGTSANAKKAKDENCDSVTTSGS